MALSNVAVAPRAGMRENLPSGTHHRRLRRMYDQTKSAAKLALKDRQRIKEGDFSSILLYALPFALVKDGLFDFIPFVGTFFGIFISVYLFIFLWGKKWKVRIVVFILSFLDLIPGANLLPMTTIYVLYAYHRAKKDFEESEEKRAQEEKQLLGSLTREKHTQEAYQARMEEEMAQQERAQEEMMIAEQQEAAEQESMGMGRKV
ncbi:MAG: hypothetical protein Q8Q10_01090 [bacterium]|nr:hypothetical protein [bacterium]